MEAKFSRNSLTVTPARLLCAGALKPIHATQITDQKLKNTQAKSKKLF